MLLLAGALVVVWILAERTNQDRHLAAVRADARSQLMSIRDRLDRNLDGDIQLVRGLASVINLEPELTQARFAQAAKPLFGSRTHLRNIAAAPDMVVRLMYPLAGNEAAVGLDYRTVPGQYEAAELARTSRQIVVAGPFDLVQGGKALAARLPVHVVDRDGQERFWGLVSAVIDVDRLFQASGLLDPGLPIEVAVRGRDATGPAGPVFFGRPSVFEQQPVLAEVSLPLGSWQIAAVPRGGWPTQADNVWAMRAVLALVSAATMAALMIQLRAGVQLERLVVERTRELAAAKEDAEAASIAKSAFLANMSHEIRTPLHAINGLANLVRRSGVTAEQAERLDRLQVAGDHLLHVINSILDLSKIEASNFELSLTRVDIGQLVAHVAAILHDRIQAKGLTLTVEAPVAQRPLIGDPVRLQQALLNLATNAVKFTERGGIRLRVTEDAVAPDHVQVRFEVEDTGIGIAESSLPALFTEFEQVDATTTRAFGGTGLGLAITRRLAALMDGEVGVRSTVGVGSTFWFTARLHIGPADAGASPVDTIEDPEGTVRRELAGQRVLLVEDDQVNQLIARAYLEDVGLAVDVAGDGVDAVAMARAHPYDLILMDVHMPRMDGLEATRQIRRLPGGARTPIVAMTANAFAQDRAACAAAQMDDFIAKPFDPDELYRLLVRLLVRRLERRPPRPPG